MTEHSTALEPSEEPEPEEEVEPEPIITDDEAFEMVWTDAGMPLFLRFPNIASLEAYADDMGFSIYYAIAQSIVTDKNKVDHRTGPIVYKRINTMLTRAWVEARGAEIQLPIHDVEATYRLPKFPQVLVQRCDDFFRAVHKKLGTEAVVILGYDTRCEGPEGWRVLVPKQENSAASCDYSMDQVMDDKDEEVMIVGSIHSHPLMSAFASHTDHGDQQHFDGVHITYGWLSSKPDNTEYHLELQVSSTTFTLTREQVFAEVDYPELTDSLDSWVERVTKRPFTYGGSGWTDYYDAYTPYLDRHQSYSPKQKHYPKPSAKKLPTNINNHTVVIIELLDDETNCPACGAKLFKMDLDRRHCGMCNCFLAYPGETIDDIIVVRTNYSTSAGFVGSMMSNEGLTDKDLHKVMWRRKRSKRGKNFDSVVTVRVKDSDPPADKSDSSDEKYIWICGSCQREVDIDNFCSEHGIVSSVRILRTLKSNFSGKNYCCDKVAEECTCDFALAADLDPEEIEKTNLLEGDPPFYAPEGKCWDCAHLYGSDCPEVRKRVRWATGADLITVNGLTKSPPPLPPAQGCDNFMSIEGVIVDES